ncbi:hypothetical protein HUO13_26135 [Saccharopolyspora erythraea]|uniref:hypothetical protein n=1 Tax=Saccharopolyspora erythraea TaxID=1836 RepID=UPI001BACC84F|nr:hypothetical protein [Saccharopolyspora erythraea]QUH03831.1 hypothetical protein HUO13_26135 [Saccharopolyspora erythraea]
MNKVADIAMGIIVVAGIFVMVRPGSQGPGLVNSIGGAFGGALKAATGGGTW